MPVFVVSFVSYCALLRKIVCFCTCVFACGVTACPNKAADKWVEVIRARAETKVEDVDVFSRHVVLYERHRNRPRITVIDWDAYLASSEFPRPEMQPVEHAHKHAAAQRPETDAINAAWPLRGELGVTIGPAGAETGRDAAFSMNIPEKYVHTIDLGSDVGAVEPGSNQVEFSVAFALSPRVWMDSSSSSVPLTCTPPLCSVFLSLSHTPL